MTIRINITQSTSQKRLAELSTLQQTSIHNQVYPLQKVDYAREVTEASNKSFVLVHLTSPSGNIESRLLSELWRQAAAKFGDVKFCDPCGYVHRGLSGEEHADDFGV